MRLALMQQQAKLHDLECAAHTALTVQQALAALRPHYFKGDTYQSLEVTEEQMTAEEIAAYTAGYEDNEAEGNFKDWG